MQNIFAFFSWTSPSGWGRSIGLGVVSLVLMGSPVMAGDHSFWGTGVGAALGGLAGSQIGKGSGQLAATGLGVFLGGAIGNSVGSSMDRVDSLYARGGGYGYAPTYSQPMFNTYEPNYVAPPTPVYVPHRRVVYVQPEVVEYRQAEPMYATGGYLGDTYSPPVTRQKSGYCREFTQKVKVGGRVQESYGTACLQPDGSWQIQP